MAERPCAAPSGVADAPCHVLGNDGIAVFRYDLGKGHLRAQPCYIGNGFDKLPYLRVFQPRVHKHGGNVGERPPRKVQQHGAVLAARKGNGDLAAVVVIPLDDLRLRHASFPLQRPRLHDAQILPGVGVHTATPPIRFSASLQYSGFSSMPM